MLFFLGVLLMVAGFALLVATPARLPGNRTLRPWPARFAGAALIAFLPTSIGLKFLIEGIDSEGQLNAVKGEHWATRFQDNYLTAVNWGLFVLCLLLSLVLLWYGSRDPSKARPARRPVRLPTPASPFDDQIQELPEPLPPAHAPAPPPPPRKGRAAPGKNPFDFT